MKLRIASVPYLNAAPLVRGLDRDPAVEFRVAPPRRLVRWLAAGEADAALLPVLALPRVPAARPLGAGCVAARGGIRSVRLFHRTPPEAIRSLAEDPDSVTSNGLARIVLAARGVRPAGVAVPPGGEPSRAAADAFVLIGDPCLEFLAGGSSGVASVDLGEAWENLAGLPFVFALWAAAPGADARALSERLRRAREEGLRDLPAIARAAPRPFGMGEAEKLAYLRGVLYDPGGAEASGAREFLARAAAEGLAPRGYDLVLHD